MSKKKKGVKAKKSSTINIEEDPKYLALLDENQLKEMNNNMLRQEIDALMEENQQKEQKLKDLELEIKFNAFQNQGRLDGQLDAI